MPASVLRNVLNSIEIMGYIQHPPSLSTQSEGCGEVLEHAGGDALARASPAMSSMRE
jgi:hypothetical protein